MRDIAEPNNCNASLFPSVGKRGQYPKVDVLVVGVLFVVLLSWWWVVMRPVVVEVVVQEIVAGVVLVVEQ